MAKERMREIEREGEKERERERETTQAGWWRLFSCRQLWCHRHNRAHLVSFSSPHSLSSSNKTASLPLLRLESPQPRWRRASWRGRSCQRSWGPQSRGRPAAWWRPSRYRAPRSSPPGWGSADGDEKRWRNVKRTRGLEKWRRRRRREECERILHLISHCRWTWTLIMLISVKRAPVEPLFHYSSSHFACEAHLTCSLREFRKCCWKKKEEESSVSAPQNGANAIIGNVVTTIRVTAAAAVSDSQPNYFLNTTFNWNSLTWKFL